MVAGDRGGRPRAGEPREARAGRRAIPSRYEGFCYAAVEATIAGVSIIASRVGSLPEVVPHATFVPPGDADALARALETFSPAPPPSGEARERFSYERIFAELERTLGRAAAEGPVRSKKRPKNL